MLQQLRQLTGTEAPPSDATDEARADADDALANELEAAIQIHLERWIMLRYRPEKGEGAGYRPTSRFVPFTWRVEGLGESLAKDNPERFWALMSGPRHDVVKSIHAEPELAKDWESVPDTAMGPAASVPPCLKPTVAEPEKKRRGRPAADTVPVTRARLVATAVCFFVAAGAIHASADKGNGRADLYKEAWNNGRLMLELAGVDVSRVKLNGGLDNAEDDG